MTIDPKKIREIARVCATLSKSAPTAEEHDIFANLASKWLSIALARETRLAIDLDRFADDGGAPSISVTQKAQVSRRSPLGTWQSANKRPARGWHSNPRYGYQYNGFRVLRFACWRMSRSSQVSVLVRRLAMTESRWTERPQAANDREMESRIRKMHENTS